MHNQTLSGVLSQLQQAKAEGCIAVVVEMVTSKGGEIFSPQALANVSQACQSVNLPLIIDECLTGMRCGASFAHLRPEYRHLEKPDLVFFGKAIGTNGIAVNFDGPLIGKLRYADIQSQDDAVRFWQSTVSRPISIPELLEAQSILEAAERESWPARSTSVGKLIRQIIYEDEGCKNGSSIGSDLTPVTGLDSLICMKKDRASRFRVMGAATSEDWVRWLPSLDVRMTDRVYLERCILGEEGPNQHGGLGSELGSRGLMPQWCWWCGDQAVEQKWCRRCSLASCDQDECKRRLAGHECSKDGD